MIPIDTDDNNTTNSIKTFISSLTIYTNPTLTLVSPFLASPFLHKAFFLSSLFMYNRMHHPEIFSASPIEAFSPMDKTLTSPQSQPTPSNIVSMEPLVLVPPKGPNDHVSMLNCGPVSQNPLDFLAPNSHQESIPIPSLSSTSHVNNRAFASIIITQDANGLMDLSAMTNQSIPQFSSNLLSMPNECFYQVAFYCPSKQLLPKEIPNHFVDGFFPEHHVQKHNNLYYIVNGHPAQEQPLEENSHLIYQYPQNLQQQQVSLKHYINMNNHIPCINQQTFLSFTGPNPTYINSNENHMDLNWEAIHSFLSGHVRPGPDIVRIFKCSICNLEFPNAQAFGGHMSSHSKNKKKEKSAATQQQFKRFNLKSSYSTNIREAIIVPSKSTALKEVENEKNDIKDKEKVEY